MSPIRLVIDSEWNDYRGALISMALIDQYGREWYEVCELEQPPTPWIAQNVLPVVGKPAIFRREMQQSLGEWLQPYEGNHAGVEILADWPEDIAHFCDLLIIGPGERLMTPTLAFRIVSPWPLLRDFTSAVPHNALADVRALRASWLAAGVIAQQQHRTEN